MCFLWMLPCFAVGVKGTRKETHQPKGVYSSSRIWVDNQPRGGKPEDPCKARTPRAFLYAPFKHQHSEKETPELAAREAPELATKIRCFNHPEIYLEAWERTRGMVSDRANLVPCGAKSYPFSTANRARKLFSRLKAFSSCAQGTPKRLKG